MKLKETSRLGGKLKQRTGSTTVGNRLDEPASSHDVGYTGPPRARMDLNRPWTYNHDVVMGDSEDPRNEGIPQPPIPIPRFGLDVSVAGVGSGDYINHLNYLHNINNLNYDVNSGMPRRRNDLGPELWNPPEQQRRTKTESAMKGSKKRFRKRR